jgi:hypothetical protein
LSSPKGICFCLCRSSCHPRRGSASAFAVLVVIPKGGSAFAFAVLVVIPEGDLLSFVVLAISFLTFRPEIACQAPQPYNRFRINNILMEKSFRSNSYNRNRRKEKRKSPAKESGLFNFNPTK